MDSQPGFFGLVSPYTGEVHTDDPGVATPVQDALLGVALGAEDAQEPLSEWGEEG